MDATLLLGLYRQMALCRRFEEAAAKAYSQGKVSGFLHLYVGQEAVAVGAISAAEPTDYVVATYREHAHYPDGTANMGAFHEGLALAGLWKLPVVFICENNQYAMGTPLYRTLSVEDVAVRARGYPMESEIVNGDDVLEVREAVRHAVNRARRE